MNWGLVLFVVFVNVALSASDFECPLHDVKPEQFFETARNVPTSVCPSHLSCCNTKFFESLSTHEDTNSQILAHVITAPSALCQRAMDSITCQMCSYEQSFFYQAHTFGSSFELCSSLCNSLYESCHDDLLAASGKKVSEHYEQADAFCFEMFNGRGPWKAFDLTNKKACQDDLITPCKRDDYDYVYSRCDTFENTRDVAFFKKEGSVCSGGEPLPPTRAVPCDIPCPAGSYLPPEGCKACPVGSFSTGGGIVIDNWDIWPASLALETSCQSPMIDTECKWVMNSSHIHSGNANMDSTNSVLKASLLFVRDGYVRFRFSVSAEPIYDGLVFQVDEFVVMPLVSYSIGYQDFEAPISKGFHVFKWIFQKDRSLSQGQDQAFIKIIEISGTQYADDKCTLCPPGTFANETNSRECQQCPEDTYSNAYGMGNCIPCEGSKYALPGSTSCSEPQDECTSADIHTYYSPCHGTDKLTRTKHYDYLIPRTCDFTHFSLPPSEEVPCAPCPPGTRRQGAICLECFKHEEALSADKDTCVTCRPGTSAIRSRNWLSFDSQNWADFHTEGWYLEEDHITALHTGNNPWFSLNISVYEGATVTFTYEYFCVNCEISFNIEGQTSVSLWSNGPDDGIRTYTARVEERGIYLISWSFDNWAYQVDLENPDKINIYNISVLGTIAGGAEACLPCLPGTFSQNPAEPCKKCPAGKTSHLGEAQCSNCPPNTYAYDEGSPTCEPCGFGTRSFAGAKTCIDSCNVKFSDDLSFDMRPLESKGVQGPFQDNFGDQFYIGVCNYNRSKASACFQDGQFDGYGCQILPSGEVMNIGRVVDYLKNDDDERSGFQIVYSHGSAGCNQERKSVVNMICNLNAGAGQPVYTGEQPYCHYNFDWESIYACPMCTVSDYTFHYTDCKDGSSQKIFTWKDNPKKCVGGALLPITRKVDCLTDSYFCGSGYYLDLEQLTCIVCPAGSYCLGGGIGIDDWSYLDESFELNNFQTEGDNSYIRSGDGYSSMVVIIRFVRNGTVSFKYKLYGESANSDSFAFSIDGVNMIDYDHSNNYFSRENQALSFPVTFGTHRFEWEFSRGVKRTTGEPYIGVFIKSVLLNGTRDSSLEPTPCPPGTYSQENSASCSPCPGGTFSREGASSCEKCDTNSYSLEGSENCIKLPTCTPSDYAVAYTECISGMRTRYYVKTSRCHEEGGGFTFNTTVPCNCPKGTLQSSSGCISCQELGTYLSKGKCVQTDNGMIARKILSFFGDDSLSTLPSDFSTGCVGICDKADVWSVANSVVSSAQKFIGPADIWLLMQLDMETEGSIEFNYLVRGGHNPLKSSNKLDGLLMYIDGTLQTSVILHAEDEEYISVPVAEGKREILWVYHYESNEGNPGSAVIKNLNITGARAGYASRQTPCPPGSTSAKGQSVCERCPPGTYAPRYGSTSCSQCPLGFYSSRTGAEECERCGEGTRSNEARTGCTSTCIFETDQGIVDLNILSGVKGPVAYEKGYYLIDICSPLPPEDNLCRGLNKNNDNNSFICDVRSHHSLGSALDVIKPKPSENANVKLVYSRGTELNYYALNGSTESKEICAEGMTTTLLFSCDELAASPPTGDDESMMPVFGLNSLPVVLSTSACEVKLRWTSFYACRLCTPADYEVHQTECQDDSKYRVTRVRNSTCVGTDFEILEVVSCNKTFSFPLIVVIAVGIIFVVLVAFVLVMLYRHRALSHRYTLLQEQKSKNVEMSQFDNEAGSRGATEDNSEVSNVLESAEADTNDVADNPDQTEHADTHHTEVDSKTDSQAIEVDDDAETTS